MIYIISGVYRENAHLREFGADWKDHCHVVARKPKRWEEMSGDEKAKFRALLKDLLYTDVPSVESDVFNKAIFLILGGVPYARIDK